MTEFKKLEPLLKRSLFRASDAKELGVSSSLLAYYVKQGLIERVARGVYRKPGAIPDVDFMWEDLVVTANRYFQRSCLFGFGPFRYMN